MSSFCFWNIIILSHPWFLIICLLINSILSRIYHPYTVVSTSFNLKYFIISCLGKNGALSCLNPVGLNAISFAWYGLLIVHFLLHYLENGIFFNIGDNPGAAFKFVTSQVMKQSGEKSEDESVAEEGKDEDGVPLFFGITDCIFPNLLKLTLNIDYK